MSQTVGELSATRPLSTKVFRRHGIDFCCGGRVTLDEACAKRGIEPSAILAEIAVEEGRGERPRAWDDAPLPDVIRHLLVRYHAPLREDLDQLEAMARKVHRVHGDHDPRLVVVLEKVLALRADLEPHLDKEEQVLFPWILSDPTPPEGPIAVMLDEHDAVGGLLGELDALTDHYAVPAGACATWTALWRALERVDVELREHIALEADALTWRGARADPAAG
jgi:regulator of cell morphogenesis and NO signaling